jgi:CheY-like chemotaxis protein
VKKCDLRRAVCEVRVQSKPRILVTDDEPVIADSLAMILNQSGFEARAVYSGEQALQVAASFAPEMLVSDVIMADLNGIETAILMRSILPQIKVLLFSGQASSADLLLEARARGYEFDLLSKPVHPKDLLSRLRGGKGEAARESDREGGTPHWIDIAPGEMPVEPMSNAGSEN